MAVQTAGLISARNAIRLDVATYGWIDAAPRAYAYGLNLTGTSNATGV